MNYVKIFEDNRDNVELLAYLAQEVNSYDGSLDYLEIYDFDEEFFDTFFEGKPMEAARATFFGKIDNWQDAYIRFNGYGNLESLNGWERDKELEESADDIIKYALDLIEDGNIDVDWYIEAHDLNEEDEDE